MASFAFGALLGGATALTAEGATIAGGIGSALQSGLLFTGVETLVRDGVKFVEKEFAHTRKEPDVSPIQANTDIKEKTLLGRRDLLKRLQRKQ